MRIQFGEIPIQTQVIVVRQRVKIPDPRPEIAQRNPGGVRRRREKSDYQQQTGNIQIGLLIVIRECSISIMYASPCPALFVGVEERSRPKWEIQENHI